MGLQGICWWACELGNWQHLLIKNAYVIWLSSSTSDKLILQVTFTHLKLLMYKVIHWKTTCEGESLKKTKNHQQVTGSINYISIQLNKCSLCIDMEWYPQILSVKRMLYNGVYRRLDFCVKVEGRYNNTYLYIFAQKYFERLYNKVSIYLCDKREI